MALKEKKRGTWSFSDASSMLLNNVLHYCSEPSVKGALNDVEEINLQEKKSEIAAGFMILVE